MTPINNRYLAYTLIFRKSHVKYTQNQEKLAQKYSIRVIKLKFMPVCDTHKKLLVIKLCNNA